MSGVRLFGFGGASGPTGKQAACAWRALRQMCFGDDFCGLAGSASSVRKTWEVWCTWAEIVGAKIGVKKVAKTVVCGRACGGTARRRCAGGSWAPLARWHARADDSPRRGLQTSTSASGGVLAGTLVYQPGSRSRGIWWVRAWVQDWWTQLGSVLPMTDESFRERSRTCDVQSALSVWLIACSSEVSWACFPF